MRKLLLIFLVAFVFVGCAPQSVRKALDLADGAVAYAAEVNTQPELEKPLDDAQKLLVPVKMNVGSPSVPQIYNPGASVDLLAKQAEMEQRLINVVQGAVAGLAEKIPVIGDKIADSMRPPTDDPFDMKKILATIMAVIAGYGGSKVAVGATKKVMHKGTSNGEGSGVS